MQACKGLVDSGGCGAYNKLRDFEKKNVDKMQAVRRTNGNGPPSEGPWGILAGAMSGFVVVRMVHRRDRRPLVQQECVSGRSAPSDEVSGSDVSAAVLFAAARSGDRADRSGC